MKTFEGFYSKGDFANALLTLEKNPSDLSPGLWHYNVGTIKAKMQNLPEARFHFLQATELGMNSDVVFNNLKIAEEKLDIVRLEKPLNASDYFIKGSLWASQGLFTSLSLIIIIAALLHLRKRISYKLVLSYLTAVLLPLGFNFWVNSWDRAVVTNTQLVQEGPSVIFPSRGELPLGVLVVLKHNGEWSKIIYPSRFEGWIKNTGLKSLE